MERFFLQFAYDGTAYHGWQMQNNANTVQAEVQKALSTLLRRETPVVGCGRTDTGVHARQFFAHFEGEVPDPNQLTFKLNCLLPKDIAVSQVLPVTEEGHARFSATHRTYEYLINTRKDPFWVGRAWLVDRPLDVEAMNQAATMIREYTDFESFSKTNTDVKTFLCDVTEAHWRQEKDLLIFTISANRFLRNMVRAVVGTLHTIGRGTHPPEWIREVIEAKNRSKAGFSVPAHGLYLIGIDYPQTIFLENEQHGQ